VELTWNYGTEKEEGPSVLIGVSRKGLGFVLSFGVLGEGKGEG